MLSNIILGQVAAMIGTNQIEIDHRFIWILSLVLVLANSRSLWLKSVFDEDEDPATDQTAS